MGPTTVPIVFSRPPIVFCRAVPMNDIGGHARGGMAKHTHFACAAQAVKHRSLLTARVLCRMGNSAERSIAIKPSRTKGLQPDHHSGFA